MNLPTFADVEDAARKLEGVAVRTPLLRNDALDAAAGGRVFVKAECLQRTGSFKFRGAYNRLCRLDRGADARLEAEAVVLVTLGLHRVGRGPGRQRPQRQVDPGHQATAGRGA